MIAGVTITLIAAVGENGVIGCTNGQLPWHIPDELKHFRRLTEGQWLAMGRTTFESLGGGPGRPEPLPGRGIILVTRQGAAYDPPGTPNLRIAGSLFDAARIAGEELELDELFVAGGRYLFRAAEPYADRFWLSRIHKNPGSAVAWPEAQPEVVQRRWLDTAIHYLDPSGRFTVYRLENPMRMAG